MSQKIGYLLEALVHFRIGHSTRAPAASDVFKAGGNTGKRFSAGEPLLDPQSLARDFCPSQGLRPIGRIALEQETDSE